MKEGIPVKATIIVSSWFKRYTGGLSSLEQELLEGETAWQAVCRAGIPAGDIGFVTVDGAGEDGRAKRVDDAYRAADGDVLRVYPLIIGG